MGLGQEYVQQLRQHFEGLHANFPPNRPLALGDYGVIRDDVFQRLGNIAQTGIAFTATEGTAEASFQFKSAGAVEFEFIAKGDLGPAGVPALRAGLEIHFNRQNAIFFNAAGCTFSQMTDTQGVGAALVAKLRQGRWEADFHVVTSLVRAAHTTVMASSSSDAEVKLEAKSDAFAEIDLADASLGLRLKRTRGTSLDIVTANGQTPLMQLSRIRGLLRDEFRPESLADDTALPFAFGPEGAGFQPLPVPPLAKPPEPPEPAEPGPVEESISPEAFPSDFELERAKQAYIPLLRASYALAHQQPINLPAGYVSLGEIRVDASEMAESMEAMSPEVRESVQNDERAMAEAAEDAGAFGLVVRESATGAVLICIRGTLTPNEWIANFTAVPNPFSLVPGFGLVHLGFERMHRSVRRSIQTILAGVTPGTRITVVGHSLGGAMAILAAVDIKRNMGQPNVDVATFGGPRTGKIRFRVNFNRLIGKCYRLTNQGDVVPHIPSVLTAWNHVGEEIEVRGRVGNAHGLDSYLDGLNRLDSAPEAGAESAAAGPVLAMRTL